MNISALKALYATLADRENDDIALADFLALANECSDDLARVARIRERATAEWAGGTEFALPDDLVEIRELSYDGETILPAIENVHVSGTTYTRWGSAIIFSDELDAAEVAIAYYRRPTPFTEGTDEPEIPAQFHSLYALWAAARHWDTHEDEPGKAQSLRAEYEALKGQLDRFTAEEGKPRAFKLQWHW
jgi:hypothetical protein